MKHQWLAYVVVGLLSIGAGITIAGLPNNVPVDATNIPQTTTEAPEPAAVPATMVPATTVPETTDPAPETTATTDPDSADSVPAELAVRSEIVVSAVNGSNVAGIALRVATELEDLGYVDVLPLNGTDIEELTTTVFFAVGFEEAAVRMADDLGRLPEFVAPIEGSPSVGDLPADIELLVYIGRDRA